MNTNEKHGEGQGSSEWKRVSRLIKHTNDQGRSQGVCVGGGGTATGANAPAIFSGLPQGHLVRLSGVPKVNFLGIHTRLPAAKCAL